MDKTIICPKCGKKIITIVKTFKNEESTTCQHCGFKVEHRYFH